MVIKLSTDLIFLGVIVLFAIKGMKRGCVSSFGGLIAVFLSWIIARCFAVPITTYIFVNYGVDGRITDVLNMFRTGIDDSLASMNVLSTFGNLGVFGLSRHLTEMAAGVVNQSALHIASMFVTTLLFSINMFVFGFLFRRIEKMIKEIPMGNVVNGLGGLIFGLIKGIIIAMIIYFAIYALNVILHTNIPLNETYIGQLFEMISRIHI